MMTPRTGAGELAVAAIQPTPRGDLASLAARVEAWPWGDLADAVLVLAGAVVAGWLLYRLVHSLWSRWAWASGSHALDASARCLRGPLRLFLPVALVGLCRELGLFPDRWEGGLGHALLIAMIVVAVRSLIGGMFLIEAIIRQRMIESGQATLRARSVFTQVRSFRNVANFLIVVVGVGCVLMTFAAVRQFGVSLLASAGAAGVIIGFAAQRSIAAVVAGIQIAITQPIRVEDAVIVEGEFGNIEEITLTYVVVRLWDLRRLVLPITYFIEKPFQNWTRTSAELTGTVFLHVDHRIAVDALRAELARILEASPRWDRRTSGLVVTEAGERSVQLRATVSAASAGDLWDLRCEVRERLLAFLRDHQPEALPRSRGEIVLEDARPPAGPGGEDAGLTARGP